MILQLYPRLLPMFQKWSCRKGTNPRCGWIPQIPSGRKSAATCTRQCQVHLFTSCHTLSWWQTVPWRWRTPPPSQGFLVIDPKALWELPYRLTNQIGDHFTELKPLQQYPKSQHSKSVVVSQFRVGVLGSTQFEVAYVIALHKLFRNPKHWWKLKMRDNIFDWTLLTGCCYLLTTRQNKCKDLSFM